MDPYIILLPVYGKKYFFTLADLYTLTIILQCMALQEGKLIRLLHGKNWANLYDGDNHILYGLGKVFSFMYDQLIYSAICYSSVAIMTYITIHVTQNNLPCDFLKQQFGKLCYHHSENCWYILETHETFRIFLIIFLIMTSLLIWIGFVQEA